MTANLPREPGGGGDLLGALQQVKVLAATGRITPEHEIGRQGQQAFRGVYQQCGVDRAQVRRSRRYRLAQIVGHDPVLQHGQRPVGLLRREKVMCRAPLLAPRFKPFGGL